MPTIRHVKVKNTSGLSHEDRSLKAPCEIVTRYVLPSIRALIAKELIERHGCSQVEAARLLGTSQSNISYYLHSKRGAKLLEEVSSLITSDVESIASWLASGEADPEQLMSKYCEICKEIRRRKAVCNLHRRQSKMSQDCDICLRPATL